MLITMHCGGLPFNGDTIKTKSLGGSETAAYYIAKELAARGHRVTLFTNEQAEGFFDGVKYIWAGPVNEHAPLGERFHFYASNTPCDVLLLQRQPGAFVHRFQSKINVCWLHDLALHRQRPLIAAGLWNIDSIFCVSEWHKKQVCEVYGLAPGIVRTVTNGVDLTLFEGAMLDGGKWTRPYNNPLSRNIAGGKSPPQDQIKLLYSSRPERGLEHHVRPGGIMDRLWEIDKRFRLYVCNYDNNPPHLASYYAALYARIEEMPNVTALGNLTKQQLADVMRQCDALVYPTEFEEVSCITAMEAMAAGLPFISSDVAALPETCEGSGSLLIPMKDGAVDEIAFSEYMAGLANIDVWNARRKSQKDAAKKFNWPIVAAQFERHFEELFAERSNSPETVLKGLVHNSDYYAAEKYAAEHPSGLHGQDTAEGEMLTCYRFARDRTWKEHYEEYYAYEKARGVEYGPEDCTHNNRFATVAGHLAYLPAGSTVCDYGCAHGHYTINLAKAFPTLNFIGIDITASNIATARKWVADDGVSNARFFVGSVRDGEVQASDHGQLALQTSSLDAVIAAEVLEHVEAPWEMIDVLGQYLKPSGKIITTTPLGPWEAIGYKEHWPWRAHVHHLEREDLHDLFGMHPGFNVQLAAGGHDKDGEALGSYICSFGKSLVASGRIDYARKFKTQAPQQTLAVCIIAKDAEHSLGRCLASIKDIADEIIVAVDETTTDATKYIAAKYVKGLSPRGSLLFDIKSPLEQGFDEARNQCIERAKADWIFWIDADEVLFHPENVRKYLRQNMFDAYAVRQLHYSVEPAGVMKTDLPSRFFRNGKGIKFFGVVHEHPEIELNKGIGHATVMGDIAIAHYGYSTEAVRRQRFERNIGLLLRDREKYPERMLGKFLWLRDLAQMCRWEAESNGGQVTAAMQERARVGIAIWEELLDAGQVRMLAEPDNLGFYSTLVTVLGVGVGFDFGFLMDASKLNGGAHPEKQQILSARFYSREHAEKLFLKLLAEKTTNYDSKYF
jgi:glycosyltransferase involved in cell wall biosynthesis/2-polyprenyl-3-methyl-5-hydroxy-6-metoxy-1,4-benzoquinol methylase